MRFCLLKTNILTPFEITIHKQALSGRKWYSSQTCRCQCRYYWGFFLTFNFSPALRRYNWHTTVCKLRNTACGFDTLICHMVLRFFTVVFRNTTFLFILFFFFFLDREVMSGSEIDPIKYIARHAFVGWGFFCASKKSHKKRSPSVGFRTSGNG